MTRIRKDGVFIHEDRLKNFIFYFGCIFNIKRTYTTQCFYQNHKFLNNGVFEDFLKRVNPAFQKTDCCEL